MAWCLEKTKNEPIHHHVAIKREFSSRYERDILEPVSIQKKHDTISVLSCEKRVLWLLVVYLELEQ
jgi:hypothetical protein